MIVRENSSSATEGQIRTGSRVHIALHDLGGSSGRFYGGVGFMINKPESVVAWARASSPLQISFSDPAQDRNTDRLKATIDQLKTAIQRPLFGMIRVKSAAPIQRGYGSTTSLHLAILEAVCLANDLQPLRPLLEACSTRGGTSGVGVHGYLEGGVIWDGGHRSLAGAVQSSERRIATQWPLLLGRFRFPDTWTVGLVDGAGKGLSLEQEDELFGVADRLGEEDSGRSIATTAHRIIPAFMEQDLPGLKGAISAHHQRGFKALELNSQDQTTKDLYEALATTPGAVGLSSMGPLLYVVIQRTDGRTIRLVERIARDYGVQPYWADGNNVGRQQGRG